MIKKRDQCDYSEGDYVYWGPDLEYGRIKSLKNDQFYFVVFNCNDDWENYKDYTGSLVLKSGLSPAPKPGELIDFIKNKTNK